MSDIVKTPPETVPLMVPDLYTLHASSSRGIKTLKKSGHCCCGRDQGECCEDEDEDGGAAVEYLFGEVLPGGRVCRQWGTVRAHHMMKMMRSEEI
jgi:hypothetical protein